MKNRKKKISVFNIVAMLVIMIFALFCLAPFWLVLVNSITSEKTIVTEGYQLWPKAIDFSAYKVLLFNTDQVLRGYAVTITVTVIGTVASLLVNSMAAYPLSKTNIPGKRIMSLYVLFTMIFSGGMVPWFIVCRNILHLKDSIWALIIPYLVSAWNIFLIRNYYQTIPEEIIESARIDGAKEFYIWRKFVVPLSKPVFATITLFISLGYWNDWWLGLMLIDKTELQPLQLMLRTITSNVQFLVNTTNAQIIQQVASDLPGESIKMATCIVTIGPILLVYPFVQKYFVKGMMAGSVKG